MTNHIKYPRTYHLPCSPGRTNDDKSLEDYSNFENNEVSISIKMDGENTTGYCDGHIHARSIDSKSHESRSFIKNKLANILYKLPKGWRICGENVYAKHSIKYNNLKSYFYLFSIWDNQNICQSHTETVEWAVRLGLNMVPVLYVGQFNKKIIVDILNKIKNEEQEHEGFVLRNTQRFTYNDFQNNVAKYVRQNHVKTDKHWITQTIEKNELIISN